MGPDALLKQKVKQKRFREGYAEGLSSTHREAPAAAFIQSENPVEMLGQYTRFRSQTRTPLSWQKLEKSRRERQMEAQSRQQMSCTSWSMDVLRGICKDCCRSALRAQVYSGGGERGAACRGGGGCRS